MIDNTTQRYLAMTLMDMCVNESLEKITVTSLAKRAGMTRATFYNHFDNMTAVIRYASFLPLYSLDESLSYEETMRQVCEQNLHHRDFYRQLGDTNRFSLNWDAGLEFLAGQEERRIQRKSLSEEACELARRRYRYLSSCTAGIFRQWWAEGLLTPIDVIVDYLIGVRAVINEEALKY